MEINAILGDNNTIKDRSHLFKKISNPNYKEMLLLFTVVFCNVVLMKMPIFEVLDIVFLFINHMKRLDMINLRYASTSINSQNQLDKFMTIAIGNNKVELRDSYSICFKFALSPLIWYRSFS